MQPLAYRMRPKTLNEFIGQDHIVGEGRLLRRAIQADQLSSVIFYGPPGTGKTTLARVIAHTTKSHFSTLNAVLSGVKELREEIKEAKNRQKFYQKKTILFVDEVHRWNKSQQDALLPWVENGTVILVGATTENPYFEVNAALVSRSRIFQLIKLTESDLFTIAEQALNNHERGYGNYTISFEEGALEHIVNVANGDARSLLNALELAVETTPSTFPPPEDEPIFISRDAAEESIQQKVVLYDKEGDYHFDVISAFIKSIRGSDPDAVLYWLARMVRAGEDPRYIFRRMLISACEDIGLADPQALGVVESAASSFDRVGMPEGRFHLTHAALYLATAPKSNSSLGFFSALKRVEDEADSEVPNPLKDGSRDKEGFGHGKGYLYPHAFKDHWVTQQYLPNGLQGSIFYHPSDQGYEVKIKTEVEQRREAQLEAAVSDPYPEILTFSPPDTQRDLWLERLLSNRGLTQERIREHIFSPLTLLRHSRVLVIEQGRGLLVWEACRQTPEGGVTVISSKKILTEQLEEYARQLPEIDRPQILTIEDDRYTSHFKKNDTFDAVIGQHVFTKSKDKIRLAQELYTLCKSGSILSLCEVIPNKGQRLSDLCDSTEGKQLLASIEEQIYANQKNTIVNYGEETLRHAIEQSGFSEVTATVEEVREPRRITAADIAKWIHVTYLPYLDSSQTSKLTKIEDTLTKRYDKQIIDWRVVLCFLHAKKITS